MENILNRIDKKYALGLITGLIFGLLSIYTDFFRSNSPEIEFEILNNTTVIDLKENIGKVDILYDSTSILSQKKTLSLITFKIKNDGNSDVLENNYYKKFPLGFKIKNGELLENPIILQTNNEFLKESITLTKINSNKITFNKFIFEKGDFFTIKIIVLHEIKKSPEIYPIGKIAGVKKMSVVRSYLNKENKGFWEKVIEGSLTTHITRFFSYLIILGFFSMMIILPITFFVDTISSKKRVKIISQLKKFRKKDFNESESIITNFYKINGFDAIKNLKILLLRYKKYPRINNLINSNFVRRKMIHPNRINPGEIEAYNFLEELKDMDLISASDGKLIIKDNIDDFINELIDFIENRQ